jgi:hypothetical protein
MLAPGLGAARVVVVGDSLSAEYEAIPDVPGTENPTAYAEITVPGWESMSWVEVLARLRPGQLDFGRRRDALPGWTDLRFTGYEFNFAIPGFQASQYEDIVNSSLFSNPQYLPFQLALGDALAHEADWAVVWLGANEFRANFGFLYDGGDPGPLIGRVAHDVEEVVAFVQRKRASIKVVLVNLPDLAAAPSKQAAHPDAARRARVTEATRQANRALADVAARRGAVVADVFAATERLAQGSNVAFGAIDIQPGTSADNNPRFAFARDGLHPNTPLQIQIARVILGAFNTDLQAAIPPITDAQALALLGIDPTQPYLDWIAASGAREMAMGADPDGDGLPNLVEYAFGLDPVRPSAAPVRWVAREGGIEVTWRSEPAGARLVRSTPEWSADLAAWIELAPAQLRTNVDSSVTLWLPGGRAQSFLRLRIDVLR